MAIKKGSLFIIYETGEPDRNHTSLMTERYLNRTKSRSSPIYTGLDLDLVACR
jgi:hypothetical protein